MINAYPEKPILPYVKTKVAMPTVVNYLKAQAVPAAIKHMAYIMFRNEGANGKSGVNNNFVGAQADGNRWPPKWDSRIIGIVQKTENGTGKLRLFVAFHSWTDSVDLLTDRVAARGLFVGGTPHLVIHTPIQNENDLANAYFKEWVRGDADYQATALEKANFNSMYQQAVLLFV